MLLIAALSDFEQLVDCSFEASPFFAPEARVRTLYFTNGDIYEVRFYACSCLQNCQEPEPS